MMTLEAKTMTKAVKVAVIGPGSNLGKMTLPLETTFWSSYELIWKNFRIFRFKQPWVAFKAKTEVTFLLQLFKANHHYFMTFCPKTTPSMSFKQSNPNLRILGVGRMGWEQVLL